MQVVIFIKETNRQKYARLSCCQFTYQTRSTKESIGMSKAITE